MGKVGGFGSVAGRVCRQDSGWRAASAGFSGPRSHAAVHATGRRHKSALLQGGSEGDRAHSHGTGQSGRADQDAGHRIAAFTAPLFVSLLYPVTAAQSQSFNLTDLLGGQASAAAGGIVQVLLILTILSIAPGILVMVTCFTRFIVALSFLRAGLGLQTTPSNVILINLALFMTWFVMAPTFDQAWSHGLKPLMEEKITTEQALVEMVKPFKTFMTANVRAKDTELFQKLIKETTRGNDANAESLQILVPSFVVSELRRGFEIGFLIALPFLVIDIVVASIVMSMGMMMVSPIVFSLPLKVLFFVLVDGWSILVAALIKSYA